MKKTNNFTRIQKKLKNELKYIEYKRDLLNQEIALQGKENTHKRKRKKIVQILKITLLYNK